MRGGEEKNCRLEKNTFPARLSVDFLRIGVSVLWRCDRWCRCVCVGSQSAKKEKKKWRVNSVWKKKGEKIPGKKVKQINGSQYVTRQTPSAFSLLCERRGESVLIDKGDFRKEKWIAIGLLLLPK